MRLTFDILQGMIMESVKSVLKETNDYYIEDLAISVSVAMVDEYGFSDESANDIAYDTIIAHSDELTGDRQVDFEKMLNIAIQDYVNEAVTKKNVLKEYGGISLSDYDNPNVRYNRLDGDELSGYDPYDGPTNEPDFDEGTLPDAASQVIQTIDNTFKRNDIKNVDREVLEKLIINVYETLKDGIQDYNSSR